MTHLRWVRMLRLNVRAACVFARSLAVLRSIIFNRLVSPVRRIGEHVRPELGHLRVVAVLARVCEKDAARIVLRRPQLARAAGARFWSPFLRYAHHFLLRVEAMTCQRPTIANGSET
jgi:hypothetical protein